MPQKCMVENCKTKSVKGVTMHRFPKDKNLRRLWIASLKHLNCQSNAENPPQSAKICSIHFSDDSYEFIGLKKRLKKTSVPTMFPDNYEEDRQFLSRSTNAPLLKTIHVSTTTNRPKSALPTKTINMENTSNLADKSDLNNSKKNIEVRARLGNDEIFNKCLKVAGKLTKSQAEITVERDVFFNATNGTLKLRYLKDKPSKLIQYTRLNDEKGPKMTKFNITEVGNAEEMEIILSESIGIKGIVNKKRHLYLHEQTRIHLDHVENLGNFLKLKVMLLGDQTEEYGRQIANELLQVFGIKETDLMAGGYLENLME